MKSNYFFKFPCKIYRSRELREFLENSENSYYSPEKEPEYVIGIEAIDINEIVGYSSAFSLGKSDELNEPDCTSVYLKNGKELICLWELEAFEKEYDKHIEKIRKIQVEEEVQEIEKRANAVRESLERNLQDILDRYKENGIKIELQ